MGRLVVSVRRAAREGYAVQEGAWSILPAFRNLPPYFSGVSGATLHRDIIRRFRYLLMVDGKVVSTHETIAEADRAREALLKSGATYAS